MRAPGRRVVRARQRDRASSIPGFDRTFPPQQWEWGIDKMVMQVSGTWSTTTRDGRAFFQRRMTDNRSGRWLNAPVERYGSISVQTVDNLQLTIGSISVRASRCTAQMGRVKVEVVANPTRTLASLLARMEVAADFRARIIGMEAFEFFGLPSPGERAPPSLDNRDNYLPDHISLREVLGPDPFAAFMPVYFAQLRDVIDRILSEHPTDMTWNGRIQIFGGRDGSVELDWGDVAVPQIETYFERFHRRAQAAVRRAGAAIIEGDTDSVLRLYPNPSVVPALERSGDQFTVSAAITLGLHGRHKLAVYAKTEDRIRFEVRRVGRGRNSAEGIPEACSSAASRSDAPLLYVMLDVARHEAQRLVRWNELFAHFDEPDASGIGDLTSLVRAISAAARAPEVFGWLLERLIVDGGVSMGANLSADAAIRALVRAGVLEPSKIRNRRQAGHLQRYRLAGDHWWLRQRLHAAFTMPDADQSS